MHESETCVGQILALSAQYKAEIKNVERSWTRKFAQGHGSRIALTTPITQLTRLSLGLDQFSVFRPNEILARRHFFSQASTGHGD